MSESGRDHLTGLRVPGPRLSELYERERKVFGSVFRVRFFPTVVERARASTVWDVEGSEYLDFSGGAAVANVGHCHPRIVGAAAEQLSKVIHSLTVVFPSLPSLDLAEKLCQITPGQFEKKVWFGSSGSDAAECVYDFLPAATGRRRIISFFGSHHGLTVGANFLSGHKVSGRYLQSPTVVKVPYPYCYRCPFRTGQECCNYCVDFIEEQVFPNICPAEDTACILLEPLESLAGEIVPPDSFLPDLKGLCDRHGILLVDDEVKTGFGRTGKLFAIEHWGVVPDALVMGKAIAGGLPLSAFVGRKEVLDAEPFSHTTAAGGNPVSCAAALATLDVIRGEGLVENAERQGEYLKKRLVEMQEIHSLIGDVRGKGLMIGVELVRSRETKEPAGKEAFKVSYRAWQRGMLVIPVGTFSNVIEITPPLVITREEVDRGLEIFEESLRDVEQGKIPDSVLDFKSW